MGRTFKKQKQDDKHRKVKTDLVKKQPNKHSKTYSKFGGEDDE